MHSHLTPVLLGHEGDSTMVHVRSVATETGVPFEFVPVDRLYVDGQVAEHDGAEVRFDDSLVRLADRSIYQRLVHPDPHHFGTNGGYKLALSINSALTAILANVSERVVNPLGAGWHNGSKLFHLGVLADCGFTVPASLCSSDVETVDDFLANYRKVVYKSNSGLRSIVRDLEQPFLRERSALLRQSPVLFQEHIAGDDIRVHVVDDAAFAVRIRSTAVDYRYHERFAASVDFEPYSQLPDELVARCCSFCREHSLVIAGFDFKLSPDRGFVCLEVNPSPAFESYDHIVDGVIARALLAALAAP